MKGPRCEGPHVIYSVCVKRPEQANPLRQRADSPLPRPGAGGWAVPADRRGVPLGRDGNVLELVVVMTTRHCECTKKKHRSVHFQIAKRGNIKLGEFYLH